MGEKDTKTTSRAKSSSSSTKSSSTTTRKSTSSSTKSSSTTTRKSVTASTPISAEEKLKKSMKGLSHMGGGVSAGLSSTIGETKSKKSSANERKKVGGVVLDMDTIKDANKQKFETKGRSNNVIILVLSLFLVVAIVYLAIAVMGYISAKKSYNCKYRVEGTASATWVVEGVTKTNFKIAEGLSRDMVYVIDSHLKIETTERVAITIEINVMHNGSNVIIYGLHEGNEKLVRVDEYSNKFVYQDYVTGGGTIKMFGGLNFSEAPYTLNSNNITIEIVATVNKV